MSTEPNTQRDELARLISSRHTMGAVDAILAAGYRKPRTITTVEELDALPVGSVAHSAAGTIASRFDEHFGVVFGDERPFEWARLRLPATILYTPEAAE